MAPFTLRVLVFAASVAFAAPAQLKPTLKPGDYSVKRITRGVTVLEREHELKRSGKDAPAKDPGTAN
jgi:hypothetical protein